MDRIARIQAFVKTIWQWYAMHKRELPWRDLTDEDPSVRAYKVMVSEIMLQQTQVSRVKIVFNSFLERFPHISDLARASNREVLLAWRGMGYNSRALRLRDAARIIESSFAGLLVCSNVPQTSKQTNKQTVRFPSTMEELRSIPGIGPYTAAAIRNFAFNLPTPCVDTNIRRILHRTFVGPENAHGTWKKDDQYLLALAEEILEAALRCKLQIAEKNVLQSAICNFSICAADWHAALMDFGSLIHTKRNPHWEECPLTAKKLMKTTPKTFQRIPTPDSQRPTPNPEPGRLVGSRFIPNRIFRGKVIEELRDAPTGLPLATIGKNVCIDWSPKAHRKWLQGIVEQLAEERMLQMQKGRYRLFEGA